MLTDRRNQLAVVVLIFVFLLFPIKSSAKDFLFNNYLQTEQGADATNLRLVAGDTITFQNGRQFTITGLLGEGNIDVVYGLEGGKALRFSKSLGDQGKSLSDSYFATHQRLVELNAPVPKIYVEESLPGTYLVVEKISNPYSFVKFAELVNLFAQNYRRASRTGNVDSGWTSYADQELTRVQKYYDNFDSENFGKLPKAERYYLNKVKQLMPESRVINFKSIVEALYDFAEKSARVTFVGDLHGNNLVYSEGRWVMLDFGHQNGFEPGKASRGMVFPTSFKESIWIQNPSMKSLFIALPSRVVNRIKKIVMNRRVDLTLFKYKGITGLCDSLESMFSSQIRDY